MIITITSNYNYSASLDTISPPLVFGWVEGNNWKMHKTTTLGIHMKSETSFKRCS